MKSSNSLNTPEKVKDKVKSMYNGEYEFVSEYKGTGKSIVIKHKPCGHVYTRSKANSFLNEGGSLCPVCSKKKTKKRLNWKNITEDKFREMISNKDSDYEYVSGFISSREDKIILYHKICGNQFQTSYANFTGRGRRCTYKECTNKNRKMNFLKENYLEDMMQSIEDSSEYIWLEEYNGDNKYKIKIKHLTCSHEYTVRPNDFQQGYRCPKCSITFSKKEEDLYNFIKDNYDGEVIHSKWFSHNKKRYELDIYLPKLNIGIEFNGYYWHSDKFVDKNYHLEKQEFFQKKKGIRVVFIDETDYNNKRDIVESKLLHIIKSNKGKSVYARKCEFTPIKNIDTVDFLNNNHIQGHINSSYQYALKYDNHIVAVMSFSKGRTNVNSNNDNEMELLRYATDINYRIPGGFSKLFKNAIKDIKLKESSIDTIKTFASKDISIGSMYTKNGFTITHESKPSYFYVYNNKKYNRYSFRKSVLKENFSEYYNDELTELENANNIPNLLRVWNCGNYVMTYKI